MDIDSIYIGCHSTYDKYFKAKEVKEASVIMLKELEKKSNYISLFAVNIAVISFALSLGMHDGFFFGVGLAFVSQLLNSFIYIEKINSIKILIQRLQRDQDWYARIYNAKKRHSEEKPKFNSKFNSKFNGFSDFGRSEAYTSRENEQRGTFKGCVTVADIKRVYRSKAKKHHPDVGGDEETFRTLVVQYERALKIAQMT